MYIHQWAKFSNKSPQCFFTQPSLNKPVLTSVGCRVQACFSTVGHHISVVGPEGWNSMKLNDPLPNIDFAFLPM